MPRVLSPGPLKRQAQAELLRWLSWLEEKLQRRTSREDRVDCDSAAEEERDLLTRAVHVDAAFQRVDAST